MQFSTSADGSVTLGNRLAILGMQWGDEGKGKLIDALANYSNQLDYVVRYQGGHNAGHTVIFVDAKTSTKHKIILHLLPSAIIHPGVKSVIANGVVLHLPSLLDEIQMLHDHNAINSSLGDRLFVSNDCPLLLPSHVALDQAAEEHRSKEKIGTTGRGIGPAYEDYYARRAIRVGQIKNKDFPDRLKSLLEYHNFLLAKFYQRDTLEYSKMLDETYMMMAEADKKVQFTESVKLLQDAVAEDKNIIFEGAQGCALDVFHGTYPYVTSSATCVGGIFSGSGVSHKMLDNIIGVAKIYATRVGAGPFATEETQDAGKMMQERGREFGSTTGRRRRCGWLDLVHLKKAVRLNAIDQLFLTKVDVMDSFTKIKLCVDYDENDSPIYKEFEGWQEDTSSITHAANLPAALTKIMDFIETYLETKILGLSVGPDRDQLILCQKSQLLNEPA